MKNADFFPLRTKKGTKQRFRLRMLTGVSITAILALLLVACSQVPRTPSPPITPQPQPAVETPRPTATGTPPAIMPSPTPSPVSPPQDPAPTIAVTPPVAATATPSPGAVEPLPEVPFAQGDRSRGEYLFGSAGCIGCHLVRGVGGNVGPDLTGVAKRAPSRAVAQRLDKPEQYLEQSIVYPKAYVVEGFNPVMPNEKEMQLNEKNLADLVAYLMTLTGE